MKRRKRKEKRKKEESGEITKKGNFEVLKSLA
jgi:hypothetical protein